MSDISSRKIALLLVAAGRGERMGGAVPKQYRELSGRPVIAQAMQPFLDHPAISIAQAVIGVGDEALYRATIDDHPGLARPVTGGASRQESVRIGLEALASAKPDLVLIHDAARPWVSAALIDRVLGALGGADAALPVLPVTDTVKSLDAGGRVAGTIPRETLGLAQTPQGFNFELIVKAHRDAARQGLAVTDDAALAEWAGLKVAAVAGEPSNRKITTLADLPNPGPFAGLDDIRTATGYDVHAFAEGEAEAVMLGGIAVPHERALAGHSDADVALHALTDAILGALADGDIGQHFPPSDARWRGAPSSVFLADAVARVAARGGRIAHLDLAIIAEAPKIGPHRDRMRQRIAEVCGIPVGRVAVKATTNERLGFVGRGEGIAALATATLRLPSGDDSG